MFLQLEKGIENIYQHDFKSQKHFLNILKEIRDVDVDYLIKLGCFFVPNQDYMIRYFGPKCLEYNMDIYNSAGECKWLGLYIIPIRNVRNQLVAFVGYDPRRKLIVDLDDLKENNEILPPKYTISSQTVFDKNNYFLCPNGIRKAVEDGYCLLVDGVFDSITLASHGFNSASFLGSDVNDNLLFILSFIPKLFICHDNDKAGIKLLHSIQKKLPNAQSVSQNKTKDIDEYISKYGIDILKISIESALKSTISMPIVLS